MKANVLTEGRATLNYRVKFEQYPNYCSGSLEFMIKGEWIFIDCITAMNDYGADGSFIPMKEVLQKRIELEYGFRIDNEQLKQAS
ncbi:hypothetical protein [Joostella sp. CR20]|uniref:hypothetical protein n=1 Tax=Joostella sp. CR20 TaxID=2804312 RepID=UPI00313E2FDB